MIGENWLRGCTSCTHYYESLVAVGVLQVGLNLKRTLEPTFKQQIFMIWVVEYIFQNKIWKKLKRYNSKKQCFKKDLKKKILLFTVLVGINNSKFNSNSIKRQSLYYEEKY